MSARRSSRSTRGRSPSAAKSAETPRWSEARVHRWMFARHRPAGLAAGFGNDAATLARALARPVICADQCWEGIHFETGSRLGPAAGKAALRALSDLAAAAARPRALVFCATFPPRAFEREVRASIRAVARAARAHGAELVAGDLCCAPGPTGFSITALGELEAGRTPPRRGGARPGDWILATGPFGGSLLGRHLRPVPRLAAGRALWRAGARAITDVSDGLARDAARLAERSGVALDLEHVPLHADARRAARTSGRSALDHALYDGEDYELIAALAPDRARRLLARRPRELAGLVRIGVARRGRGVRAPGGEAADTLVPIDPRRGWSHGAR